MYRDDNHFVEAIKVRSRVSSLEHEIFLDESISEPEYYRNAISLLRNEVGEKDTVHVYISNGGGMVHTASLITDAMATCKGKIVGFLSGQCCSAATAIAMHCDEWVVGNNLHYMVHGITYGVLGKATDIEAQQDFTKKWGEKLFRDTYTGFLTEDEMELTLKYGKEHWFDTNDVKERLQNFAEHRQKQQEAAIEDVLSLQTEQSSEMEKVLHKQLVESKQFSQEEIDLAQRINEATFALDESLSDEEFSELMEKGIPPESLDDEPEDTESLCKFEAPGESTLLPALYYSDTVRNIWAIHKNEEGNIFLENEPLEDVVKNCGLKKLCNLFQVKLPHNIKSEEKMYTRLEKRLQQIWEENAS